eukprot:3883525-Karenia_brevis.AAC.1
MRTTPMLSGHWPVRSIARSKTANSCKSFSEHLRRALGWALSHPSPVRSGNVAAARNKMPV